jgi:hypothetical protein
MDSGEYKYQMRRMSLRLSVVSVEEPQAHVETWSGRSCWPGVGAVGRSQHFQMSPTSSRRALSITVTYTRTFTLGVVPEDLQAIKQRVPGQPARLQAHWC